MLSGRTESPLPECLELSCLICYHHHTSHVHVGEGSAKDSCEARHTALCSLVSLRLRPFHAIIHMLMYAVLSSTPQPVMLPCA